MNVTTNTILRPLTESVAKSTINIPLPVMPTRITGIPLKIPMVKVTTPIVINDNFMLIKNGHLIPETHILQEITSTDNLMLPPIEYSRNLLSSLYSRLSMEKSPSKFLKRDKIVAPHENLQVNIDYPSPLRGKPFSPFLDTKIIDHVTDLLSKDVISKSVNGHQKTVIWSGVAIPAAL